MQLLNRSFYELLKETFPSSVITKYNEMSIIFSTERIIAEF